MTMVRDYGCFGGACGFVRKYDGEDPVTSKI